MPKSTAEKLMESMPPGVRKLARQARYYPKLISKRTSSDRRRLPDFVIIGGQKCGTTSLYDYLLQHPQIAGSFAKEVKFFDVNFDKGLVWYQSHFPLAKDLGKSDVVGEATPYYLFHPQVPPRMAEVLPEAKLIVLLRNPADRAISNYFMRLRAGNEPLSLEEALDKEEERIGEEYRRLLSGEIANSRVCRHFAYKKRSLYLEQLERYAQYYPRERMLILKSEDLFSDPSRTLRQVFTYLGVDPGFVPPDLEPKNVGSYAGKVPAHIYDALTTYFEPHNKRLYEFLGRDMGW